MKKKRIRRLDVQVSILTAVIVILSSICMFLVHYDMTYKDMLQTLRERTFSIYEYLDKTLNRKTFQTLNTKEDMNTSDYTDTKVVLDSIRETTGVRYLYTAKKTEDGTFIYIVDGLDEMAEDFRYPGDPIEKEIIPDMQRSLDGEIVLPDDIKPTEWGRIFITYFPIYDDGEMVGVIGIEFDAEHQYRTYKILRYSTPIIIFITCFLSIIAAVLLFKRISNPTYQDMSNTDFLTGLKNRNAYDIDMNNMIARHIDTGIAVLVSDLNSLKIVNDTLGHRAGDIYIQAVADVFREAATKDEVIYRTGGDEYVVIFQNATDEYVTRFIQRAESLFLIKNKSEEFNMSLAMGYAIFHSQLDHDIMDTYKRADKNMYLNKKAFGKTNQSITKEKPL